MQGANSLVTVLNRSDSFKQRQRRAREQQNLQGCPAGPAAGHPGGRHTGRHCEVCHQFDMLPSECQICHHYFCMEHQPAAAHGCSRYSRRLPVCPVCNKAVMLPAGCTEDEAMDRHISSGCTVGLREEVQKAREESSRCAYGKGKKRCKDKSLIKIECPTCRLQFCIKHRSPKSHKCKGPPELKRVRSRGQLSRQLTNDLVRVASDHSLGSPTRTRSR